MIHVVLITIINLMTGIRVFVLKESFYGQYRRDGSTIKAVSIGVVLIAALMYELVYDTCNALKEFVVIWSCYIIQKGTGKYTLHEICI